MRMIRSGRCAPALGICERVAEAGDADLRVRVGVTSGEALVSHDPAGGVDAVGDVVNTAARLESAAPLGGVLGGWVDVSGDRAGDPLSSRGGGGGEGQVRAGRGVGGGRAALDRARADAGRWLAVGRPRRRGRRAARCAWIGRGGSRRRSWCRSSASRGSARRGWSRSCWDMLRSCRS